MSIDEREALLTFLDKDTPLLRALEAFSHAQQTRYQADCAGYMASIPRDLERASDAAAKAEAYNMLWPEIISFARRT